MKKLFSFACAIAVGVALSSTAFADIMDNTGAGFIIPDNDPAGASSDIVIGANEVITGEVAITLFGASHSWVGDLQVSITGPGGTQDLMFNTGGGLGDSSNLGGDYTFVSFGNGDGGAAGDGDWWAEAALRTGAQDLAPGTYGATTESNVPVDLATFFGGTGTAGTWTLFISDNAGDDTGEIQGWGISAVSSPIPEPGSLTLLGALGIVCVIRRR